MRLDLVLIRDQKSIGVLTATCQNCPVVGVRLKAQIHGCVSNSHTTGVRVHPCLDLISLEVNFLLKMTLTSHLQCPATWCSCWGRGRHSPCPQVTADMTRRTLFGLGYSDPGPSRLRLGTEKSVLGVWCQRCACWQNPYSAGYHPKPFLMGRVISKIQDL